MSALLRKVHDWASNQGAVVVQLRQGQGKQPWLTYEVVKPEKGWTEENANRDNRD